MAWLGSALTAVLSSAFLLAVLYAWVYLQHRRRYLVLWSACWAAYAVQLVMLSTPRTALGFPGLAATSLLALASAWLLWLGVEDFLQRRASPWLHLVSGLAAAWAVLAPWQQLPYLAALTPVCLVLGFLQACAGWSLARGRRAGLNQKVAGWGILLWGVHRADYPFLHDLAWVAPWGFILGSLLTVLVALSLLLMFFESLKDDAQEARDTLQKILDLAPVGIGLVRRRKILWANDHLARMLGRRPGELSRRETRIMYAEEEEYQRVGRELYSQLERDGRAELEMELARRDGSRLPVQALARQVEPARPERGHLFTLVDLSELKRNEEGLKELAAGVAHNFNNVLMAVTSSAEAAQRALERPEGGLEPARRFLANIRQAAQGGRDVSRRLSTAVTAHLQDPAEVAPVELGRLAAGALELAGGHRALRQGRVRVQTSLEPELWASGVRGELLEVLQNLVANALDALEAGGTLRVEGRGREGEVVLSVADDGPGMDPDTQARAFDPFFTTKTGQGQGLGLTTTLWIVRAHRGRIELESRPGGGARVTVRLPACPPPAPAEAPRQPEEAAGTLRGLVLVVEDNGLVALGLQAILGEAGLAVEHRDSVAGALAWLEERRPDLVVCDFGLPDGNAWDVHHRLAARAPECPLVVLTGYTNSQRLGQEETGRPPAWTLVTKPVEGPVLLQVVHRLLARGRPAPAA
jgi:PAS domain S-box-containing protein